MDGEKQDIQLVERQEQPAKKKRRTSRPPLSKTLISIMIDFLIHEDRRPIPDNTPVWTQSWLELLKEDTELKFYAKGLSLKQRFFNWLRLLEVFVLEDGVHRLCLAGTKRIVPCKEEFQKIIRDAHRSTGEFEDCCSDKAAPSFASVAKFRKHNSVEKCIRMIKDKYAFGNREFGIRKTAVYREVLRCPDCHHEKKRKQPEMCPTEEAEMIDPDFGNEMDFILLKDAPISMALQGPSEHSVWYNQLGLANEDILYKKLLGIIEEVGTEVGNTIQSDRDSQGRLMTKIFCAEKLINDLKKGAEKRFAFRIPSSRFLMDYNEFAKEYLSMADPALYLMDMNYLLSTYRKYRNTEFIDCINNSLKQLNQSENSSMKLAMNGSNLFLEGFYDSGQHTESKRTTDEVSSSSSGATEVEDQLTCETGNKERVVGNEQ